MENDLPGTGAPDAAADASDGWTSESHSAPNATADAPPDTTLAASAGSAAGAPVAATPAVATADADLGDETDAAADADTDADPEGAAAGEVLDSAVAKPVAKPAGKGKKGPTLAERRKSLTDEVNRLTYEKHQAATELETHRAEVARLKAEGAALAPAKPAAPAAAPAKPAETDAMPPYPKFGDYDDIEKYQSDVDKYQTDLAAWQSRRETRLRDEITQGVDTRFSKEAQAQAQRAELTRVSTDVQAEKAAHPDWDEKAASLQTLRSSWHDPAKHGKDLPTPFLSDVTHHVERPGKLLYWIADLATTAPDQAQRLADLHPTQPLRDAVVMSPSPEVLLAHFSTDEGSREFEALKGMHPVRLLQAVGALSERLSTASRGPVAAAPHPITQATPSAKPPAGTPRAQDTSPSSSGAPFNFENWMKEEDAREQRQRAG